MRGEDGTVDGNAHVTRCGRYRYVLNRWWTHDGQVAPLGWIMLNPSTADADTDDPTIRKCMGFARRWGFDGIRVVNLFPYRATSPAKVAAEAFPRGDVGIAHHYITETLCLERCVAAWGAAVDRIPHDPVVNVDNIRGEPRVVCLGMTKAGHPRHPGRISYTTEAEPF